MAKEKNEAPAKKEIPVEKKATQTKFFIADRGVKRAFSDIESERNKWRNITYILGFVSLIAIVNVIIAITGLQSKYFILPGTGQPLQLQRVATIPLTNQRVLDFTDEALRNTLALNFAIIDEQIADFKKYYEDEAYQQTINILYSSNTIDIIKKNNMVTTIVPTNDDLEVQLFNGGALVTRSYVRTEIVASKIAKTNIKVKVRILTIPPDDRYPWGLYITNFRVENKPNS